MHEMRQYAMLSPAQRKEIKRFDRRQKYSDRKFQRGTRKHPGGTMLCGTAAEAETRAMRRPFGKTPRRAQSKRRGKRRLNAQKIRLALAQTAG